MSWGGAINMCTMTRAGAKTVPLDMSVSVETAEIEWYQVAEETTYAPKVTAYRERFEALKLQAETGKPAPAIEYPAEPGIVDAELAADPELRFGKKPPAAAAAPKASPFVAGPVDARRAPLQPPAPPAPALRVLPTPSPVPTPAPQPTPPATPPIVMPETNQGVIGDRLKEARLQSGWKAGALEEALGLGRHALYAVEDGSVRKHVAKVVAFLHIREEWLQTGKGEIFETPPPPAPPAKPHGATLRKQRFAAAAVPPKPDPVPPPKVEPFSQQQGCMAPAEPAKPPLGLRPRYIAELNRIKEIALAIHRYAANGQLVPVEWVGELVELTERQLGSAA